MAPDMQTTPKRPPHDRDQGRKSLSGQGVSPVIRIRCDPDLKRDVDARGPEWARQRLREAIDRETK